MSGIKVPVSADISQLKSDLETLTREAEKVSRALGNKRPEIDTSRAMEALKRLWAEANKLESKLSSPGKIDLGVAEASEQLLKAREAAEGLARAIHGDGVSAYSRATREAREYHRTISGILHDQHRLSDLLRREVVGAGGSVVGAIMPGFGNVAGTASRFAAGGGSVASMIGRGALGAVAGAAVYGAIKTAQHVQAAEQEAIATSDLRRTIGALTGDFEALRDAARNAVYFGSLGVTSTEFLGYERQYAKIAGGRGVNALTGETAEAIKIARAMGLEPGEGVGFFGASQRFRATGSDEQGQRRFAGMIAEAIGKVGFAQSSEVLQAVAGFMGSSARGIVGPAAGTDEYTRMLANLTGPGSAYGADVAGAASLLSRMDAGFRGGFAGAGPGGQAFSLGVLQSLSKVLNATDVKGVMEAGMDATMRDAIGESSVMYQANISERARYRQALKDAGPQADVPMSLIYLRAIEKSVPPSLRTNAVSNAFGVGEREAATYRAYAAQANSPEEFKKLVKEGGLDKTQQDDGEKTRDSIAKVETALNELAAKLLPAQEAIRQAVLFAAGKTGSQFQKWVQDNDPEIMAAQSVIDEKSAQVAEEGRYARWGRWGTGAGRPNISVEEQANLHRNILMHQEELEQAQARKSRRLMELKATQVTPSEAAAIRSAAKKYGVPENWFFKEMALENSGAKAVSPAGARGRFQLMPGNLLPGEDPTTIEGSADAMARVFRDAVKLYGPDEDAVFAYVNGGRKAGDAVHAGKPAPYKETRNYLDRAHKIDDPLPDGHKQTGADKIGSLNINGQFTLIDAQGNQRAEPVSVSHQYGLPHTGLA